MADNLVVENSVLLDYREVVSTLLNTQGCVLTLGPTGIELQPRYATSTRRPKARTLCIRQVYASHSDLFPRRRYVRAPSRVGSNSLKRFPPQVCPISK